MSDYVGAERQDASLANALTRKLQRYSELSSGDTSALYHLGDAAHWIGPGSSLLRETEAATTMVVVLEGIAFRHKDFRDGRRQIIGLMFPGDTCGGHARCFAPVETGVRSLTRVRVAHFGANRLFELAALHPGIARALQIAAVVEEAVLRAWIINLGQRRAHERMAHLLCEVTQRMTDSGLGLPHGGFEFPLTQHEIGSVLGLTSVHVNRVLQRLRSEKLIELRSGVLWIRDTHALRALAGFDPAYLAN